MIRAKELIRKLDGFTNYICWMWTDKGDYKIVTERMLVLHDYEVVEVFSANKFGDISIQVRELKDE